MLLNMQLTKLNPQMTFGTIECCYVQVGSPTKSGAKIFDIRVDLSAGNFQYCPPISYFRMVARESGWLKEILVKPGDDVKVGDLMAVFSTDLNAVEADPAARPLRLATAGITHHSEMWSARDQ